MSDSWQLVQEIRYNFSRKSRTNGFIGAGYWRENVQLENYNRPNEQHFAYLLTNRRDSLISGDWQAYPLQYLPVDPALGTLSGNRLPALREETTRSSSANRSIDLFGDVTMKIRPRLSFSVGVRGSLEKNKVTYEAENMGDTVSVLGTLSENRPNLLFRPTELSILRKSAIALTWRSNIKFDFNSNSNIYLGYSKGRRPHVLQFRSTGTGEIKDPETVHNFESGIKWSASQRYWIDATAFYLLYRNFQSEAFDSISGRTLLSNKGRATSYGAEVSMKAILFSGFEVFGNYTYIHARFDSADSRGFTQNLGGNRLRYTPEHSFSAGVDLRLNLTRNLGFFVIPSYSWKSHIYFDDSNTPGMEQAAHGLLQARAGLELLKPALVFALYGTNLLGEKFVLNAGNTGASWGIPSFIPGAPRILGTQLLWRF